MTNDIINNPALKQFQAAPHRKIELDPSTPSPLFPSMCCETPGGDILVIDDLGHAAFLFTPSGKLIRRIGGKGSAPAQFNHPAAAAIAADGRIFIADCWNHRVQIFTPELDFISTLGSPGNYPGQLLEPSGVAIFNGNIVISEIENRRLSIFEQNGNFISTLRSLSGLEAPLSYITSITVVGRFLAALMDSSVVLILEENFICENIIRLNPTSAPPAAIYAAGEDVLLVASNAGGVTYYALEGSVIRSDNTIFSNLPHNEKRNNDAGRVYFVAVDLCDKQYWAAKAPSFKSPLYNLLATENDPDNGNDSASMLSLISGICVGSNDINTSRVAEFNRKEPNKFRAALLKSLLKPNNDDIKKAEETAINILKRTPAIHAFHSIAAASALHRNIREYQCHNSVEFVEQIEFTALGLEGRRPLACEMVGDGDFFVFLFPEGLLRVNRHGAKVVSSIEPETIIFASLAYDGSFAACTQFNELVHIDPEGRLIRTLTPKVAVEAKPGRMCAIPRTRDGRMFVWPNPSTSSLDTFDLFCSSPNSPVDRFSPPGGIALDTAFPEKGRAKHVLTTNETILCIDASNNIEGSHSIPTVNDNRSIFIDVASDGAVLVSQYNLTNEGNLLAIAKLGAQDYEPLFFMNSFSSAGKTFQNVINLNYILRPILAPDNSFWLLDRFNWKLYKFKIGIAE